MLMLPTFPKIVAHRRQENMSFVKRRIGDYSPIQREIRAHIQHEGREAQIVRQDDDPDPTTFIEASAQVSVKRDQLSNFGLREVASVYDDVARQFAEQQSEMLANMLSEVTAKTGNVVDGAGGKLSAEMILKVYETMELSFSPDGAWQAPVFWGGSRASASFADIMSDPQFQQQLTLLVDRKRIEFRRREADRVLAG